MAAKHLHVWSLGNLRALNQSVDFLALAVPILFFPLRFLTKGTDIEHRTEYAWEALAAILLVMVVLKLTFKWQEKIEEHSKLLGENLSLVHLADSLLSASSVSTESGNLFLLMASKLEQADRESLGKSSATKKQSAYREALKEWNPGDVSTACPKCNASPWEYFPGNCQLCGNTPRPTTITKV